MTISEVTAVTTADLTGSVGLVCCEAATHKAVPTVQCQAQITASAPIRNGKCRRTERLSRSFFIGCPGMVADSGREVCCQR